MIPCHCMICCHNPKYTLDMTWRIGPREALHKILDIHTTQDNRQVEF